MRLDPIDEAFHVSELKFERWLSNWFYPPFLLWQALNMALDLWHGDWGFALLTAALMAWGWRLLRKSIGRVAELRELLKEAHR